MVLSFDHIETQLVEWLPEVRPAAEIYWNQEGKPGDDAGAYILFEGVFSPYIDALLSAPVSTLRNEFLQRAFEFVDACLLAGGQLRDLVGISVFEGQTPSWLAKAHPFMGSQARSEAQTHGWANAQTSLTTSADLYGVQALVDQLLAAGPAR